MNARLHSVLNSLAIMSCEDFILHLEPGCADCFCHENTARGKQKKEKVSHILSLLKSLTLCHISPPS